MSQPTVLAAGHITHDRYGQDILPGGGALYGAMVYSVLGADVHLVTAVGEDFACDEVTRTIPSIVTRSGRTTMFTNLYPRDAPRIQLIEAVAPEVLPAGVPEHLLCADVVHLAPVFGEVDIAAWKAVARPRLLALNVQGWIREPGPAIGPDELGALLGEDAPAEVRGRRVVEHPWTVPVEALRGIDVACLSTEDLVGQGDLMERLCEAIPLVALTHGRGGCELMERGTKTRIGIHPSTELDFTGAGDTFAAGFVYQLALGASPIQAARFGAACASIVIEGIGTSALTRLGEAHERAGKVPVL